MSILGDPQGSVIVRSAETLAELAAVANRAHAAGEAAVRKGLEEFRVAGEALIRAKAQLGHGRWLPWVKQHLAFTERTARRYMAVARNWGKSDSVSDLTAPFDVLAEHDAEHEAIATVNDPGGDEDFDFGANEAPPDPSPADIEQHPAAPPADRRAVATSPEPPAPPPAAPAVLPVPRKVYCPCPYLRPDGTHEQCTDPRQCKVCRGQGDLTEEKFRAQTEKVRGKCRVPGDNGKVPDYFRPGNRAVDPEHPHAKILQAIDSLTAMVSRAANSPGGERLRENLAALGSIVFRDLIRDGRHFGHQFIGLRHLRRVVKLSPPGGKKMTAEQVRALGQQDEEEGEAA